MVGPEFGTDFNIPGWLRYGSCPEDPRGETPVSAWGPFLVWLEDAELQPAYVGSRLRFFWDRPSATRQVSFFPVEPPSLKIYTLADDTWPEISDESRTLQFRTLEHGWMELQPVPPAILERVRRDCHLTPA